MTTIVFNPYPPKPPVPFPPGRLWGSGTLPGGSLSWRFYRHYNRRGGASTDAVQLTGADLRMLQTDGDTAAQIKLIEQRMVRRALTVLDRLPCEETAEFTDAGYELMPTTPYSTLSWAIGRYSLYWQATGIVGPRRCGIYDPECEQNERSDAAYSITIDWTAYDVFDFGWRILYQPWMWFGTPFHVFGIWQSTVQGTAQTCRPPPPVPPPCQEPLTLTRDYEVLAGLYREGTERPPFSREGAIDSAMGRLLQDAKEWCSTGGCSEAGLTCVPRFEKVSARLGGRREEAGTDGLVRVFAKVHVVAEIKCRCALAYELDFPQPR